MCIKGHYQQSEEATHGIGEISEKGLIFRIYKKNFYNSTTTTEQLKNGQNTWRDISVKKTYKWLISTWKYAQHHESLGKCK